MMTRFFAAVLFLTLGACTTQRNFYVLSPIGKPPVDGRGPGIGIGPVVLADYLVERPYVAFQSSPNKLEISDLHEWAGDPKDDFSRVLASNMGRRMKSGNVRTYPWDRESELRYTVSVDVRQFHGTADGDALLEASWRAYAIPGSRLLASRTTTLREPLEGDGFEALVAAQSRLIDRLAGVIASKLK